MKTLRIVAVCAFGVGSSMLLKMRIEEVLEKNGITAEIFTADATSGAGENYDLAFTSRELTERFRSRGQPVIAINNFLSTQEIEQKGMPVIMELLKN